jgi:hypothetical protein
MLHNMLLQAKYCILPACLAACMPPLPASALAAAVKSAAASYKPKPTLKVPSLDELPEVPKNLHKRLELIARVQLAGFLERSLEVCLRGQTLVEMWSRGR